MAIAFSLYYGIEHNFLLTSSVGCCALFLIYLGTACHWLQREAHPTWNHEQLYLVNPSVSLILRQAERPRLFQPILLWSMSEQQQYYCVGRVCNYSRQHCCISLSDSQTHSASTPNSSRRKSTSLPHPYYTHSQQWPSQPWISLYLHDCLTQRHSLTVVQPQRR